MEGKSVNNLGPTLKKERDIKTNYLGSSSTVQ
jgi:hypothetical protein